MLPVNPETSPLLANYMRTSMDCFELTVTEHLSVLVLLYNASQRTESRDKKAKYALALVSE
jgi:hypothetical protein